MSPRIYETTPGEEVSVWLAWRSGRAVPGQLHRDHDAFWAG